MSHNSTHSKVRHEPVMLANVMAALAPAAGKTYIDGTFGAGGYSRAILAAADCKVIALDRDPDAIANGAPLVAEFDGRLKLVQARFSDMHRVVAEQGLGHVDGVVLDIGVSSMQIDEAVRGFSFLRDGPLDMRMSQSGQSAADRVNSLDHNELSRVIFILGDEPRARSIARAIVTARSDQPLRTTHDLVRVIESVTGPQRPMERIHPATKTFQALRILVNGELTELEEALNAAEDLLSVGGRLVVVTFHSLEDRIVKRFFTARSGRTSAPSRHQPTAPAGHDATFDMQVRGHTEASVEEVAHNPRARSAKMRSAFRNTAASWPKSARDSHVPRVGDGLRP